jgi:hypothetical protein
MEWSQKGQKGRDDAPIHALGLLAKDEQKVDADVTVPNNIQPHSQRLDGTSVNTSSL